MTWLVISAFLKRGLTAIWTWLSHRSFWQLVSLGLAIFAVVQYFQLAGERRHSVKLQAQIVKCSQARHADQEAYRKAQAEAQAKNVAHVQQIERQQKEVSDETVALLNSRIARLRSELRNPAPQSHSLKPGLSPGGQGPSGTAGEARMCLSTEELLRAAESEERHDRLIDWAEKQSAIKH